MSTTTSRSQHPPAAPDPETAPDLTEATYIGRRRLVPTPRQLQVGDLGAPPEEVERAEHLDRVRAQDPDGAAEPHRGERRGPGRRARDYLRSINPLGIDGPRLPVIVLGLSAALGGWSSAAIGLAGPEIQATFGTSVTQLVLLGTVTSTFMLIIGIPLGYLVDRFDRVLLVRISAFLAPVGDVIQASTASFGVFTLGSVFGEVSRNPAAGADMPLLSDYYRAGSRARAIGFLSIAGTIGGLISAPVVGWLIASYGWRSATISLAAMSVVVAALTLLLREPRRGATDRLDMGVTTQPNDDPPPPSLAEALRGAWSIRTLRLQAIAGFVATLAAPLNLLIGLVLASRFALGPQERSWLNFATSVLVLPAILLGIGIADRLIRRRPSTLVALQAALSFLSSIALIIQAYAPNLFVFFLCSVVPAMISSVFAPINFTVMTLVIPARYRGVGLQIFTPFALVSLLLTPVLVQFATQISLEQSFLYFSPLIAVSGLIYLASAGTVSADIHRARSAAVAAHAAQAVRPDGPGAHENRGEATPLLICRGVQACIGEATILDGVDLDVRRGEILGVLGTNGAGKSTLLTAICGLNPATNGAIFFDGHEISYQQPHQIAAAGVGYLPGGKAVFGELSVLDNLRVVAGERPLDEVFAQFPELADRRFAHAHDLSGGEQQMLALGLTFLRRPALLLIDELSLGLAPAIVQRLIDALRLIRERGTTVVLVEQSVNLAVDVCDRIVFMDQGAVKFTGTPVELMSHPELARSLFMGAGVGALSMRGRTRHDDDVTDYELMTCGDVTLQHAGVRALDGVTFGVTRGELVGVIGPNGAGKTSLFDVISGYEPRHTGRVTMDGQDVTDWTPDARARRGLSRAFQDARLFGALTVRETIAVASENEADTSVAGAALWLPGHRVKERRLFARVDDLIDLFGLARYADVFVRELSTGTRRAVEVACHTAAAPSLLLLDEPSSGLAQAETEALGPMMRRIVHDIGCTVIVIEHDLPLLTSVCDRLIALERGALLTAGPPDLVLNDERVRAAYLQASGSVLNRSGSSATLPTGERPS